MLKSELAEIVQNTPWSYVVQFETTQGYIYLKQTPKLLALEAEIIQILHNQFHAPVPEVIAYNDKLSAFLMKDAGISLRGILKKQFDAALLCKAIDQFTGLQLTVAEHINILLDIGVPDWRLDKLPDLFKKLLSQKEFLLADGLLETEMDELSRLLPTVTNLCQQLSQYRIRQSLVQPDFNDNNTLIDEYSQKITIIDLGEIVISHPFFSLHNCLYQIKKHYALTEKDSIYLNIKDACLHNFMAFESRENLLKALELSYPLWFVYWALAGYRLINACDKSKIMSVQHGKISNTLRDLITVCNEVNE